MAWRLGEILIQKKWISWEQLEEALEEQEKTKELLGEILVRKKFLPKLLLFTALAQQHRMRFVDLHSIHINPQAVQWIPRSVAQKYSLLPIDRRGEVLFLGISTPRRIWPEGEIKAMAKVKEIRTVLCLPEEIQQMIEEQYGSDKGMESGMESGGIPQS
jgi:type IV pilus assembly protein PilB